MSENKFASLLTIKSCRTGLKVWWYRRDSDPSPLVGELNGIAGWSSCNSLSPLAGPVRFGGGPGNPNAPGKPELLFQEDSPLRLSRAPMSMPRYSPYDVDGCQSKSSGLEWSLGIFAGRSSNFTAREVSRSAAATSRSDRRVTFRAGRKNRAPRVWS